MLTLLVSLQQGNVQKWKKKKKKKKTENVHIC